MVQKLSFGIVATPESFGGMLEDKTVWGVDLKEVGLDTLVVDYFNQLNQGPGAVRKVLRKYLA